MFFYGICNLYVYALAYLSWPVEVKFKEYEIDLESAERQGSGAQQVEMTDRAGQKPGEKLELEEEEKEEDVVGPDKVGIQF